jgi:RES domain-containing protein
MKLFRAASTAHRIFDGTGAFLKGGRWNSPGRHVIYCAQNLSCCRLELLVHIGFIRGRPVRHAYVEVEVPDAIYATAHVIDKPPAKWDHPTDLSAAQKIGDEWLRSRASLILRAPSVASRGDWVIAINPHHPDFDEVVPSAEFPLTWDERLFVRRR